MVDIELFVHRFGLALVIKIIRSLRYASQGRSPNSFTVCKIVPFSAQNVSENVEQMCVAEYFRSNNLQPANCCGKTKVDMKLMLFYRFTGWPRRLT